MSRPGGGSQPPRIDEKYRIPARVAVVIVGYLVYLAIEPRRLVAAIFCGAGTIALGWTLVDGYTTWRHERSGMIQAGTAFLGLGLLGVGAYLAFR